jgi:hypothetical protein
MLQPPTFQDKTLAPRPWVSLEPIGLAGSAISPTHATLTLTLHPSSTVRAVWGKFERNYARAFRSIPFWTYVGNSVIIVVLQLGGALFSSGSAQVPSRRCPASQHSRRRHARREATTGCRRTLHDRTIGRR